jgi:capsular exopolysaccharide synthesis family protein
LQEEKNTAVLFTSTYEGEGKTTLSLLLAIELAESGKKVIWLDCDFHKRRNAYKLNPARTEKKDDKFWGLIDYLNLSCEKEKIIYSVKNKNLNVIPVGSTRKGARELIGKPVFQELINQLRKEYDYIILDGSAAGVFLDSRIMASKCDGVIYVIEYNRVKKAFVKETMGEIRKYKGRILGAVLNKSRD